MVTVVFGHGQVMVFPDDVFSDLIDHALDHIEEYKISFDPHQLFFFKRIRDTLLEEPKKDKNC